MKQANKGGHRFAGAHFFSSGLLFSLSCVNPIPFSVRVNRMGEAKHAQLSFPHRIVRRRHYRTRKRSFTLLLPSHSQNENQLRERTGRERGGGGAGPQGRGKGGVKAGGEREREREQDAFFKLSSRGCDAGGSRSKLCRNENNISVLPRHSVPNCAVPSSTVTSLPDKCTKGELSKYGNRNSR